MDILNNIFSWNHVVNWLGSAAVVAALFGCLRFFASDLFGKLFSFDLDKRLAKHNAELREQTDVKIARLTSELRASENERHFRFSQVFERTANTIEKTYELLVKLQDAVRLYAVLSAGSAKEKKEERYSTMQSLSKEFTDYYPIKRIYIPNQTAKKIDVFFGTLARLAAASDRKMVFENQIPGNQNVLYSMDCNIAGLDNEITESLIVLHGEFQFVLGFPKESSSKSPIDVYKTLYTEHHSTD